MKRGTRTGALVGVLALALSGCGFSPYQLPLPGGADVGDDPYTIKIEFGNVLDLVPHSSVRVGDLQVGRVKDIKLDGFQAILTAEINGDVNLPANAEAAIKQTSLLGEKYVSIAPPKAGTPTGELGDGDTIPLAQTGSNPDVQDLLGSISLLFNGGGLDKVNTIARELNLTLEGNEPEVKALLRNAANFAGRLDDNKAQILNAIEQVNRLSVVTKQQEGSISAALEELPGALAVLNDQRDDLVKLLQALDRLGDVATGVIKRSKADTIADLQALVPITAELNKAGNDIGKAMEAFPTFPLADTFVGGTVAQVTQDCSDASMSNAEKVQEGACFGDFANLRINMDLTLAQGQALLGSVLGGGLVPAGATPAQTASASDAGSLTGLVDSLAPLQGLTDGLLGGLLAPKKPTTSGSTASPAPATGTAPTTSGSGLGGLCALLGCRTPAQNLSTAEGSDVGRILIGPAVAR